MLKNFLLVAVRNLFKNKAYSVINIGGLSVGMAVGKLIGLWIVDELSFDAYHQHIGHIAKLRQHITVNGNIQTEKTVPLPLAGELRSSYARYFRHIVMSSHRADHVLGFGEKKFTEHGVFLEPAAPEMFTLKMLEGNRDGLKDPASILLSESAAKVFFGNEEAIGKLMMLDNRMNVKVTGVYENLPRNSTFSGLAFIAPFQLYVNNEPWLRRLGNTWSESPVQAYVQIVDREDMAHVSSVIRDIKLNKLGKEQRNFKPRIFLDPMSQWHLYSEFSNGVNTGGKIRYVWMFGAIAIFVLLLACINFMNLSTARSQKRAREVGVRKAVGSLRSQLIIQFYAESLVITFVAFAFTIALIQVMLPAFNQVAGKEINVPWRSPVFWICCGGFAAITGLIAGSYPAFYLSSFHPVAVLKGTFRVGRFAAIPRKVLVVLQFTVSVTLIICTVIVFRQVQFARERPVGYNPEALVLMPMAPEDNARRYDAFKDDLIRSGAVTSMAQSESTGTDVWGTDNDLEWEGKDPALAVDFPNTGVSADYGKTVGWQLVDGRDFSTNFPSDSSAFILNEAAVKFMGFADSVGQIVKWKGRSFTVIGVIKDVILESPYEPVRPSVFCMARGHDNFVIMRINPAMNAHTALAKVEAITTKYFPARPFEYRFIDDEYEKKFGAEKQVGRLAGLFSALAVFISCLGLFGLASFVAEQRTKEIGVRKALGATAFQVFGLLSQEFVSLVLISLLVAFPVAYGLTYYWLQHYPYRTSLSAWIFGLTGMAAICITLFSVSFQAIKAALTNPVNALRSE